MDQRQIHYDDYEYWEELVIDPIKHNALKKDSKLKDQIPQSVNTKESKNYLKLLRLRMRETIKQMEIASDVRQEDIAKYIKRQTRVTIMQERLEEYVENLKIALSNELSTARRIYTLAKNKLRKRRRLLKMQKIHLTLLMRFLKFQHGLDGHLDIGQNNGSYYLNEVKEFDPDIVFQYEEVIDKSEYSSAVEENENLRCTYQLAKEIESSFKSDENFEQLQCKKMERSIRKSKKQYVSDRKQCMAEGNSKKLVLEAQLQSTKHQLEQFKSDCRVEDRIREEISRRQKELIDRLKEELHFCKNVMTDPRIRRRLMKRVDSQSPVNPSISPSTKYMSFHNSRASPIGRALQNGIKSSLTQQESRQFFKRVEETEQRRRELYKPQRSSYMNRMTSQTDKLSMTLCQSFSIKE